MARNFSAEVGGYIAGNGERGSSKVLLLLLILVVAAGGYLYYFTDYIRPQEGGTKPPEGVTGKVVKPLPARQTVMSSAQPMAKPAGVPTGTKPLPAKQTALPSQPKPAAMPAKPAAKTVQSPIKAAPQPLPAALKPVLKAAKRGKKQLKGHYTLLIGVYVLDKSVYDDKARVKKAGLTPVVRKGGHKRITMNRLLLASFADKSSADAELKKLQKVTDGAFILQENGKYAVYAGSYFVEGMAAREQDTLYKHGINLVMKKVQVTMPVLRMTAGSFASHEAAQKEAARLKKRGLDATVIKTGE
jgi:cell division septation protein DedD